MSGHSKWSKVKHQKATTDAVKSRDFTKASRALTVAVKEGGGVTDPDKNFRLRLAVELAKSVNMPKDTIERAIERGNATGGAAFEQLVYEGYGPGGVAYLVEAATDNRQRTGALVKHAFDHAGGSLATPGAVGFQFAKNGVILIKKEGAPFDRVFEAALRANAIDAVEQNDVFEVYTNDRELYSAKTLLEREGFVVEHADVVMKPINVLAPTQEVREQNDRLTEALESLDDVQRVYTNME